MGGGSPFDDYMNGQSGTPSGGSGFQQERTDITEYFSDRLKEAIQEAVSIAISNKNRNIDTQHLLLGIIRTDEVVEKILKKLDLDKEGLENYLVEQMGEGSADVETPGLAPRAKNVLQLSFQEAMDLGHNYVGSEHVLLGLIKEGEGLAAQTFEKYGISYTRARQAVQPAQGVAAATSGDTFGWAMIASASWTEYSAKPPCGRNILP